MKKLSAGPPYIKFIAAASAFTWAIAIANSADAAQLQEARVTQVVNDVKLLLEQAAPRPAVVSDLVRHGNAVRTGTQSRSELTFADLTITRLGANTIFSFKEGTREMTLTDGAILFQVPKGSGGATIRTVGVTAAITGTTGIGEFHPATTSHPQPFSKWLCLEGTFHLYLANGQSVEVGPGKMVTTDGKSFSKVMTFDIAKLVSTSLFFTGFDTPLASLNLIVLEEQNQLVSALVGTTTANPLDPTRIVNVINQAIVAEEAQASPSPSVSPPPPPPPTPTPSKFGTPSVITSPVPYLITSGTVITTDPSITTNGVTNFGKIYRGPTLDGAFSLWAFGSTSAFDTALGVDNFFADPTRFPIAAFKFQSLSLTGNPTIDTSSGGVTKLALIGVDGITSGPPGGTLTFTGLDLLALATVNGSINLTSDVSFQDLNELAMYARGAGSNLILDSPISNIGDLKLGAEGSIQLTNPGTMNVGQFDATAGNDLTLQIGGSLLLNGKVRLDAIVLPGVTVASGANLTLNTTGDFSNSSTGDFSAFQLTNQGTINQNGNISLGVNGNLNCANGVLIQVNNELDSGVSATHGGTIGGDSSISVSANTVSTEGFLVSLLNENDQGGTGTAGGHIGGAASIAINVNGALTANANNPNVGVEPGAFDLFIENYGFGDGSPAGFIGSNASVSIAAASISTAADFAVGIDNFAGGTIGGAAQLSVTAGSMSVDEFFAQITNGNVIVGTGSVGGHIAGAASITFNITGALNVAGGTDNDMDEPSTMSFLVNNSGLGSPAGSIGSDASIDVTAGSISDDGRLLRLGIFNSGGGMIGGNASITVAANSISAAGPGPTGTGENLNLLIDNSAAGNIDGSATISLNAGSVSAAGALNVSVFNNGGMIGGNAAINLSVGGNLTTGQSGFFNLQIGNTSGGQIGGDASIFASIAGNLNTADLNVGIQDYNGGVITGAGNVTLNVGGTLTNAENTHPLFLFVNTFSGGFINNGANIVASVGGDLSSGNISAGIQNQDGGTINTGGNFSLSVGGNLTTAQNTDAGFFINNFNGGFIGNGGSISASIGGNIATGRDLDFTINNNTNGTIGSDATIDVAANNISVAGSLNTFLVNQQGSIGGNAAINFLAPAGIDAGNGAFFAIVNDDTGGTTLGGTIHGDALVHVTADHLSTEALVTSDFNLFGTIHNSGGSIVGNSDVMFDISGAITTQGRASFDILNFDDGGPNGGGTIGGDATVNVSANSLTTTTTQGDAGFGIVNGSLGSIGGSAIISLNLAGDLTAQGNASFVIDNNDFGLIGSDATINVAASSISVGGGLDADIFSPGGNIGGSALLSVAISGEIATQGDVTFSIFNNDQGSGAGTIGSDATINVTAANISTGGSLFATIFNTGGNIVGNANLNFSLIADLTPQGNASFVIDNNDFGLIGSDATINVAASSISVGGGLDADIFSPGGNIGGSALLSVGISGEIATQGDATFSIFNEDEGSGGGSIGGDAVINVNAANITANSLLAQIDNTGGSIGASTEGGATINMNVSSTASVTNDATVAIYGSDGAVGGAGININGGNYNVGGTFLSYIDGNGTITFNNASAHADVLKAGVFGANGALNISGGTLSADSILKLYAPGSNGQLNFMSNVTLGGNSMKILAANSVTIFNNIVVTIGGLNPADVYTNNANYSEEWGGNGTTTGTFAGAGANNPLPLDQAPPFGPSSPAPIPTRTRIHPRPPVTTGVINVSSSDELLALLDDVQPGRGGRIRIPDSERRSHGRNASRTNAAAYLNAVRRAEHLQAASSFSPRRLPQ